jgi:hypothetical protein
MIIDSREYIQKNVQILINIDPRRYIFCVAMGLERGPLSPAAINEELRERTVAAPL